LLAPEIGNSLVVAILKPFIGNIITPLILIKHEAATAGSNRAFVRNDARLSTIGQGGASIHQAPLSYKSDSSQ
jgi:hypothetical protein